MDDRNLSVEEILEQYSKNLTVMPLPTAKSLCTLIKALISMI